MPVIGEVVAAPFTLVFPALRAVKSWLAGLEMTHDCMPAVIHPISDVSPLFTFFGFVISTIPGLFSCTWHCALEVIP